MLFPPVLGILTIIAHSIQFLRSEKRNTQRSQKSKKKSDSKKTRLGDQVSFFITYLP